MTEFETLIGIEPTFSSAFLSGVEFAKKPNEPKPPKGSSKPIQRPKDTGVFKKHLPQSGKK